MGILVGDCELYQREYPDSYFSEPVKEVVGTVLNDDEELIRKFREELFTEDDPDKELMLKFMSSNAFPAFFSIALPLLKYGIAVRPVLLDNMRRYVGYLNDYDMLLMSYEYMKPDYPDINNSISSWVKEGGQLIYIGDGSDPFNNIDSWWKGRFNNPAEHLFMMLGISPEGEKSIFTCGDGTAAVYNINPSVFAYSKENAGKLRDFFLEAAKRKGYTPEFSNHLILSRDRYIIAAVMDESINNEPLVLTGLFADMFSPDFEIVTEKILYPEDKAMLCDLTKITEAVDIIGTSVRIDELKAEDGKVILSTSGAGGFNANIRIKLPFIPQYAEIDGEAARISYDKPSSTALISFYSKTGNRTIVIG